MSFSLSVIDRFNQNGVVLANFQENEQLWFFGDQMTKSIAPDSVLKKSTNFFSKVVNKIITVALKVIFSIGRLLTGQSDKKNLAKMDKFFTHVTQELDKEFLEGSDKEYYLALEKLSRLRENLLIAKSQGLENYKSTCLFGKADLFKLDEEIRTSHAEDVKNLIDKLEYEVVPQVSGKISDIEWRFRKNDTKLVSDIFDLFTNDANREEIDLSKVKVTSHAFKIIANSRYGEGAVKRALEYYGLEKRVTLLGADVAALLLGIVTNITLSDLKEIHDNKADQNSTSFENLTDEQLCSQLSRIRNIDYKKIVIDKTMKYREQLIHDQSLLCYMGYFEEYNGNDEPEQLKVKSLRKYSYAEFLARYLSYGLYDGSKTKFPEGLVFAMYDKQNKLCIKQAINIVSDKGLHGALIKPVKIQSDQDIASIQLIFKGTSCADSLRRDFSPSEAAKKHLYEGPGRVSFEKNREEIIKKSILEIKNFSKSQNGMKVVLEVMGHSLGGCDSQRVVESLANRLREKNENSLIGINLYAFNSPNVEADIAKRFIENITQVKIPFKLRYFDAHHDPLQEFGTKRLGYCGSRTNRPENLSISIYKFNRYTLENLVMLAKNTFERIKFTLTRSMKAHSFDFLKLHEQDDLNKYNTTFIQNIYTDNIKDLGISYGMNTESQSTLISHREMDDHLLTNVARIGREIKRASFKVSEIVSFGYSKGKYIVPKIKLKDDANQYDFAFGK